MRTLHSSFLPLIRNSLRLRAAHAFTLLSLSTRWPPSTSPSRWRTSSHSPPLPLRRANKLAFLPSRLRRSRIHCTVAILSVALAHSHCLHYRCSLTRTLSRCFSLFHLLPLSRSHRQSGSSFHSPRLRYYSPSLSPTFFVFVAPTYIVRCSSSH